MEDELIKYETAKLAKEKGFDLKCKKTYYSWLGCYSILDNEDFVSNEECEKLAKEDSINLDTWLTAPTQSLLQRWLRELYSIDVSPYPHYTNKWRYTIVRFNYSYHESHFKADISRDWSKVECNTYEEALELGLLEALKLI